MTRLRTVSTQDPGWRRVRCGRGFRYLDCEGSPLAPEQVARIRELVIPPAWNDVWICTEERGHLQAVGVDAAGRKQYLYHPVWRVKRDSAKFERVHEMARKLPSVRRRLRRVLRDGDVVTDRSHVLATAVRLIDLGCFRIGSEAYAEENGSHGLSTLERRHVRRDGDARLFCFVGKAGVEHEVRVDDREVLRVIDRLTDGRRASERLLAAREDDDWKPIQPAEVNDYIRSLFRLEVTAKDFRTWHGTVSVAAALSGVPPARSRTRRAKQVKAAVDQAAQLLGNTPTVARSSYVDPRVIDLFESGQKIDLGRVRSQDSLDRAVVRLLDG